MNPKLINIAAHPGRNREEGAVGLERQGVVEPLSKGNRSNSGDSSSKGDFSGREGIKVAEDENLVLSYDSASYPAAFPEGACVRRNGTLAYDAGNAG
jgi:hypothetical protein